MTGRLAGKVALITGGGAGIGRACGLAFATRVQPSPCSTWTKSWAKPRFEN